MKMLVKNCSDPNKSNWIQCRGKLLGTFTELEKCEAALALREGLSTTEDEEVKGSKETQLLRRPHTASEDVNAG